jgi:hypothetical protein
MVSEVELEVRALSYLLTAVIHHQHEIDPFFWPAFLQEIKADHKSAQGVDAQVLGRAIAIIDHALKPQPVPGDDR